MNEKITAPNKKAVVLSAGAACAFTLAALIEIVPSVLERGLIWPRVSALGLGAAAIVWWFVFFQWKRKLER